MVEDNICEGELTNVRVAGVEGPYVADVVCGRYSSSAFGNRLECYIWTKAGDVYEGGRGLCDNIIHINQIVGIAGNGTMSPETPPFRQS